MLFYYYTHEKYALDAIINQKIKLSLLQSANDPFELKWDNIENTKMRDYSSINTAMICFSKNPDNPLMWGHYSDNHKGICLGFEIDENKLIKVEYEEHRVIREPITFTYPRGGLAGVATDLVEGILMHPAPDVDFKKVIKSKDWKYEEEYRLYCSISKSKRISNEIYLMPFNEARIKLKEVIVGYRCSVDYINLFRTVEDLYKHHVKIYDTKLSEDEFKIIKNRQIDWVFMNTSHYNSNR